MGDMWCSMKECWQRICWRSICAVWLVAVLALTSCNGMGKDVDKESESQTGVTESVVQTAGVNVMPEVGELAYVAEEAKLCAEADVYTVRGVTKDGSLFGIRDDGSLWGTEVLADAIAASGQDFGDARSILMTGDRIYAGFMAELTQGNYEVTQLRVFDLQGKILGNVGLEDSAVISLGEGPYIIKGQGEYYARKSICLIDEEKFALSKELKDFPAEPRGVFLRGSTKEDLYFYTADAAYRYSWADNVFYQLFSWTDVGILGSNVGNVWKLPMGDFYVQSYENGTKFYHLTAVSKYDLPEKDELVLAVLSSNSDGNLQRFVTDFNKSQTQWHVTIRSYVQTADMSDYDEAQARMNADFLSNNPPDLVCLSNLHSREDLARNGYFMDLSPFLDASELISREDYYPQALEHGMYGDTLYTIPYSFSMETLVVPSDLWEGDVGWTYDEMIDYLRAHNEYRPLRSFLYIQIFLLNYTMDYFWDGETRECHFDGDEFKKLLEYCKECKEREQTEGYEEDRPFVMAWISPGSLDSFARVAKEKNQKIKVMGWPSPDGMPKTVMNATSEFSILSTSKKAEGAWLFMESYLATEPTDDHGIPGFSMWSNRHWMQKIIDKELALYGKDHEDILDEDGNVVGAHYQEHIVDQECVDQFLEALESVRKLPPGYMDVRRIVFEEADAYWEGQKSLEQVTDVIQKRVKLFLAEQ